MSGDQQEPGDRAGAVAGYRAAIEELMASGQPFEAVEEAIDNTDDLTRDQKAALWLFGFSLRDQDQQQREALAHLAAVQ